MIEQFSEKMLLSALEKHVSDIHISPMKEMYHIYFRYLGELIWMKTMTISQGERLIAYFKYMTSMNVGEKRKPQSGSCQLLIQTSDLEIRTSTISNFKGQESLVIRLLKCQNQTDGINHFFPHELKKLYGLLECKQGLVIFSGPVDSGKTTTIHQLLRQKYEEKAINILTLEDPVELIDDRFLQAEVNELAGVDYDELIKASLRHHPDVLMIGEIRDEKTAKMAVRAALTGHLVVATIHAKSCLGVIERLKDLDVSSQLLKETLTGIVSQRLLPRFCYLCQDSCHIYCTHLQQHQKRMLLTHTMTAQELTIFFDKGKKGLKNFNSALYKAYDRQFISTKVLKEYLISD